MNYFEFYNIPVSFKVDIAALKDIFYKNSKKYHPDFYTLESEEKQTGILELSTLNNEAYKTLKDFDKRMKYILEQKGIMNEEGKNKLPQSFLMDMMEINEALMELEFDYDEAKKNDALNRLENQEHSIYSEVEVIIENYEDDTAKEEELKAIKDYYLKKRYLLRIRENLDKFASL
jgi:molecular chaperone HscB